MGMMEIRNAGYYIVKVSVTETAPYTEQNGIPIQTDPDKLESKPGKTWIKVIED